jgi:hypothetical protein
MTGPEAERALSVCLVARNASTIGDLRAYLEAAGVGCRVARKPCRHAADAAVAVVVFPDDHPDRSRAAIVERLRRSHRIAVVVTRDPQRYRTGTGDGDARGSEPGGAVILPRPAFGWEILDALRGRLAESPRSTW